MTRRLWPGSGDSGSRGSGDSQEKVYDLLKLYGPQRTVDIAKKFHEERDANSGISWEENKGNVVRQVGHIIRKLRDHGLVHDVTQGTENKKPQWAVKAPAAKGPVGKPKRRGWNAGGKRGGQGQRTDLYPDPPKHEPGRGLGRRPEDMTSGRPEDMGKGKRRGGREADPWNPENMGHAKEQREQQTAAQKRAADPWNPENMGQKDQSSGDQGGGQGFFKPAGKPADPPDNGGDDNGGGLGFFKKV